MSESTNMNSALTFEATERKGANRGVEFKLSPKSYRACELACKVALMHEAARDSSLTGRVSIRPGPQTSCKFTV